MDWQTLLALAAIACGVLLIEVEQDDPIRIIPTMVESPKKTIEEASIPDYAHVQFYDWKHLQSEPHILIAGPTGSGKSTLARKLLSLLGGKVVIIDPHGRPSDWDGLPVTGAGRNYGEINSKLLALVAEMERRYKSEQRSHDPITVVVDEVPAIAANCPNWSEGFASLIREARKVSIRLVILTQGTEVTALGIKGAGQIRDSLCPILLGQFAISRLQVLQSKKRLQNFQFTGRACLVRDVPASI